MSQLVKIIMINGHLPGVVELDLDGHTNICGSNASGKTTLQRMIPVFYGEQPNRVVPKTRDNFDKYYLPHQDSYIVYEYIKPDNQRAQVVLTKRADGVDYRFVDHAYEPNQYVHELGAQEGKNHSVKAFSYAEWGQQLRQLGIDSSHKISATSEYRAIIQNDIQAMRGSSKDRTKLRQLASRYALAAGPHKLRHLEKLVSAVHAKEGKMDTLKSMLVAILEEEGHGRPENTFKQTEIRAWIQEMRQFMRLDDLQKQFKSVRELLEGQQDSLTQLWQLKPQLANDERAQKQIKADAEAALSQLKQALETAEREFDTQRSELNGKLSEARTELANVASHIEKIDDDFEAYRDQDMDVLARDTERLPQLQSDLQEIQAQYTLLTEQHSEAKKQLDEHEKRLLQGLDKLARHTEQKISDLNGKREQLQSDHHQALQAANEQLQQQREAVREDFAPRLSELRDKIARLKARVDLSPLTQAEQEQQQLAERRVDDAQQQYQQQLKQVEQQREQLEQARQQRQQANETLVKARQYSHELAHQLGQLKERLHPTTGTLRHFLQQHLEGWQQHIGKVIAEPLLGRKDLNPNLQTPERKTDQQQLFGVVLDWNAIELPEYAQDEAQLIAEIKRVESAFEQAEAAAKAAETELKQRNAAIDLAETALTKARQQLNKLERDIEYARDSKLRLQSEQAALVRDRQGENKQQLAQAEKQLNQAQEALAQKLQQTKDDSHEQSIEQEAQYQDQLALLDEQRESLRHDLEQKRHQVRQDIKALEAEFSSELAAKGVDESKLQQTKARVSALQTQIENVKSRQNELRRYEDFMQVTWAKERPRLLAREQRAKQDSLTLNSQLEQLKQRYEDDKQQNQKAQQQQRTLIHTSETQLKSLVALTNRLLELPPPETASDSDGTQPAPKQAEQAMGDLEERLGRSHSLLESYSKVSQKLKVDIEQFEALLRRDAKPEFLSFIEQGYERQGVAVSQLATKDGAAAPTDSQKVKVLAELLEVLESQQQQVADQGKNIGGQLDKFFTVFNDTHKHVSLYSRRLTEAVGDDLALEGIQRSEVKISSTIAELDFWRPLERLIQQYRHWHSSGRLLPDLAYLETLEDVATLLRANQEYNLESLLKLELHLNDRGSELVIRNDRQLAESSSHGMAYLILCKFLLAFTRLLRPEAAQVIVHWPIDEIGTLAYHNVEKLFKACDANQICIVGAFPNPESDVLGLFKHRYLIEPHQQYPSKGQLKRIQPRVSPLAEKLRGKRAAQEVTA